MQFLTWMEPRNRRTAARTVSMLALVAVVVTLVYLPLTRHQRDGSHTVVLAIGFVLLAVTALASGAAWLLDEATGLAWACCPVLAVVSITVIDLATRDASISAQLFFLLPVLYAASLLSRHGTAVMLLVCLAGEAVVVLLLLPFREAVVDAGYVSVVLVVIAAMLVRGAEQAATLVGELEKLAATDPLTGLVTRRAFDEATTRALAASWGGSGTSLILLDLDWFKLVNDRFGHPGGDEVLVQLAQLLVDSSRRGDVVCRMGGDELAILLPGCTVEVAHRRAEEMVARVRESGFPLSVGSVINVSVSAGLAHSPTHAQSFATLYAAADAALYQAKRAGRDRVVALAS